MTIQEFQAFFLRSADKRIAPEDFFVLLAHATGKDKTFLLAHPEYMLDAETEAKIRASFARRVKREPVAYIVGHKEFYGRDFLVTPDTLIPRPETELLVELILKKIQKINCNTNRRPSTRVTMLADVGTGSGNIIVTLAKELHEKQEAENKKQKDSDIRYYATDISKEALTIAQKNAKQHGVDDVISFCEGNLLEPIVKELAAADEIIIAGNLPYLSEEIWQSAANDVKLFEPQSALVSDQAGLDHYYRLLDQINAFSKPTTLFLEISPEQALLLKNYLTQHFPRMEISIHPDLSGRNRVVGISSRFI